MKWGWLTAILIVYASNLPAQKIASGNVEGFVQFAKDSTYWVAVVSQKGVVSDVFKVGFEATPNYLLLLNGSYRIKFKPNLVQFKTINGKRNYVFRTNQIAVEAKKGLTQWKAKSLARINPIAYPWVELQLYKK